MGAERRKGERGGTRDEERGKRKRKKKTGKKEEKKGKRGEREEGEGKAGGKGKATECGGWRVPIACDPLPKK